MKLLRNLVRPPAGCLCSQKGCQSSKNIAVHFLTWLLGAGGRARGSFPFDSAAQASVQLVSIWRLCTALIAALRRLVRFRWRRGPPCNTMAFLLSVVPSAPLRRQPLVQVKSALGITTSSSSRPAHICKKSDRWSSKLQQKAWIPSSDVKLVPFILVRILCWAELPLNRLMWKRYNILNWQYICARNSMIHTCYLLRLHCRLIMEAEIPSYAGDLRLFYLHLFQLVLNGEWCHNPGLFTWLIGGVKVRYMQLVIASPPEYWNTGGRKCTHMLFFKIFFKKKPVYHLYTTFQLWKTHQVPPPYEMHYLHLNALLPPARFLSYDALFFPFRSILPIAPFSSVFGL